MGIWIKRGNYKQYFVVAPRERPLVGRGSALPEPSRPGHGLCHADEFCPLHPATSPAARRLPHRNRRKSSLFPQKNPPDYWNRHVLILAGLLFPYPIVWYLQPAMLYFAVLLCLSQETLNFFLFQR